MLGFLKKLLGGDRADIKQILADGAIVIDVRTKAEYKAGHVKGSINIPLDTIPNNVAKIKKYGKPIVTCCRSGSRSGSAARFLKQQDVEVYNGGPWEKVRAMKGRK